jgi:SAM-dependent methyltransferase
MSEIKAYSQAADTGKYDKSSGILGKYDNVRRFWEDQLTGIFLRPFLNALVEEKRRRLERLRIVDLGCGCGDGYDLIMGVTREEPGIYDYITEAITADMLQEYIGFDINEDLLCQAQEHYGDGNGKMRFAQADFSQGLSALIDERPFDIYMSSYGTMSHFTNEQTVKIFSDICRHAPAHAFVIGDWLGRYSYEWQELWHHPVGEEYFMDYRISYIYPEEERQQAEIVSFPLRLMTRDECLEIIETAGRETGITIRPLLFFDRSIFVGRHLDTGDYNRYSLPQLRRQTNSLFEGYTRTDLESLLVDYVPRPGFEHLNSFFETFFLSCNTLIEHTIAMLRHYDCQRGGICEAPPIQPYYPEPLREAISTMRSVIEGSGWLDWGDPRANIIEPHLGYSLRKLEMELQPAIGVGHSLVGVFEITK